MEKKRLSNQIKMASIHFIAGLWLLILPLPMSYGADVTLTVGDSSGAPGSSDVSLEVGLDNPSDRVRSIQMDVCDYEDYLSCTGCEPTERTSDFLCTSEEQENGCCRIIFIDLGGGSITEGAGSVLVITYDVSEDAPLEECTDLNPEGISIRDENKDLLEVTSVSGEFCFSTPSTTSTTTTTITTPSIDVLQDPMWKSRWMAIPYLMVLEGKGTNFMPFKTRLSFEPTLAIVPCFYIVWDSFYIWNFVLIMPAWLSGFDDQTVTVTAATGDEMAEGDVEVKLLPFILNHPSP